MILAALIGVLAGVAAGMLGIGGGILFVPALTILLDHGQVEAEATSLLAIVPVALVGSWRQRRYGNLRIHDAAVIGALSIAGVVAGVAAANALPERVLRIGFALLLLNMARQLTMRGLAGRRERRAQVSREAAD
ncbi:MAG TPA: TSUP family transporter [Conexibacter sp.]|nr:TSUP family transporter [Conexibacter sp.]